MFEALLFAVFVGLLAYLAEGSYRLGYEDGYDDSLKETAEARAFLAMTVPAEDRPAVRDPDA